MTVERRVRATQRRGARPRRIRPCRCRIGQSPQTITCALALVSNAIGERLTTTLSGVSTHPGGLASTRLLALECRGVSRQAPNTPCVSPAGSSNRVQQPGAIIRIGVIDLSYRLSGRHRLSAIDDNLGHSARVVLDRGAGGHNAQRRLHAIQTLSQLSYSPTVSCSVRSNRARCSRPAVEEGPCSQPSEDLVGCLGRGADLRLIEPRLLPSIQCVETEPVSLTGRMDRRHVAGGGPMADPRRFRRQHRRSICRWTSAAFPDEPVVGACHGQHPGRQQRSPVR